MENIYKAINLGNYKEVEIKTSLSAFEVFKRFYPVCKNVFLLESLGEEGKFNRYSYIGFDPLFTISAFGKEIIVNGKSQKVENPYKLLSLMSSLSSKRKNSAGFCGGLVGYVSYEGTYYFEPAFKGHAPREFANFEFGFFQDGLRFDKKGNRCVYFHHGQSRLDKVLSFINRSGRLGSFSYKRLPGKGKTDYKAMIKTIKAHINKGNVFQTVPSLKSYFHITGDRRRIYALLRHINPSPYMSYLKFGDREIISASPELLIRVKGKAIEHFGTLAGTIKRGQDEKEDQVLAHQLRSDEKEMAEHMMLVDLARNDLGKICKFGSIKVGNLATVKRYRYVQHLYSEVRGILNNKENCFSALASCFPAGTLSGAPKVEAMKLIQLLEGESRGPYGGVIGYFSLNNDAMFAIAIRSFFIKGEKAYTQTGSGIVLDSVAEKECEEIERKQKGIEEALRQAQGKTLRQASFGKTQDKSIRFSQDKQGKGSGEVNI